MKSMQEKIVGELEARVRAAGLEPVEQGRGASNVSSIYAQDKLDTVLRVDLNFQERTVHVTLGGPAIGMESGFVTATRAYDDGPRLTALFERISAMLTEYRAAGVRS